MFGYVQPTICDHELPAAELAGDKEMENSTGVTFVSTEILAACLNSDHNPLRKSV